MNKIPLGIGILAFTAVLHFGASTATAQCLNIDFENLAVGTIVTTQYSNMGVTFSHVLTNGSTPGSCAAPRIVSSIDGGTSSPTRALGMWGAGCGVGEFNTNLMLRINFTDDQKQVSFSLGNLFGSGWIMHARAFNAAGVQVGPTQTITSGTGVHRLVKFGSAGGPTNIRRIDIDPTPDLGWAFIDDLRFGNDEAPTVQINSPTYATCVCGSQGVTIHGQTCTAPGGSFAFERHEYRSVNAAPGTAWTHVTEFSSQLCSPNAALTFWNTAAVPHGTYYYRVTVGNHCGTSNSEVTLVHVVHQVSTPTIASPVQNESVCGKVEFWGTVNHAGCGTCYTVGYRPAGSGGAFIPIEPGTNQYCGAIINCRLATWDTQALGIAPGAYEIRVVAENNCGHTASTTRTVIVDPSACPCTGDLTEDGNVGIADLLMLLGAWGPCP